MQAYASGVPQNPPAKEPLKRYNVKNGHSLVAIFCCYLYFGVINAPPSFHMLFQLCGDGIGKIFGVKRWVHSVIM